MKPLHERENLVDNNGRGHVELLGELLVMVPRPIIRVQPPLSIQKE
jgi:hypothetical protein